MVTESPGPILQTIDFDTLESEFEQKQEEGGSSSTEDFTHSSEEEGSSFTEDFHSSKRKPKESQEEEGHRQLTEEDEADVEYIKNLDMSQNRFGILAQLETQARLNGTWIKLD